MPQVILENFRFGLDTRRSALTSVLGTLATLRNAHVNQGGEIEKRKTFQKLDLTVGKPEYINILGVEALRDSIMIFGGEEFEGIVLWPGSMGLFSYQPLIRKAAASAESATCDLVGTPNYCAFCEDFTADVKATSVIHSSVFNGKTFVIAGMADGTINAFYDGDVVEDINFLGRMLPDMNSNLELYCAMVRAFQNVEGYTADLNDDSTPTGVEITGQPGREFSSTIQVTGALCNGTKITTLRSATTPDIPGKVASGFFQIQDGVARGVANRVTSILIGTTELLTAAVNFNTDAATTAADVVAAINAAGTPFNAINRGNTITIYTDTVGDDYNNTSASPHPIVVTTSGRVIIGKCSVSFLGTGFTVQYIRADGINLLSSSPVFSTGALSTFVATLENNINAGTGTHGYVALARENTLKLSKQVTRSDPAPTGTDDLPQDRQMVPIIVGIEPSAGKTGTVTDADISNLEATIDHSPVLVFFNGAIITKLGPTFPVPPRGKTLDPVRAIPIGGVPPYRYFWRIENETNMGIVIENFSADSTHLIDIITPINGAAVNTKAAILYLDITDADGHKATSQGVPVRGQIGF